MAINPKAIPAQFSIEGLDRSTECMSRQTGDLLLTEIERLEKENVLLRDVATATREWQRAEAALASWHPGVGDAGPLLHRRRVAFHAVLGALMAYEEGAGLAGLRQSDPTPSGLGSAQPSTPDGPDHD